MDQIYTSNELFHFVGHNQAENHEQNYTTLTKILQAECVSHFPHIPGGGTVSYTTYSDKTLISEGFIIPTVVCFADIPFDSLGIHTRKYGKFGLSFSRSFLIQYGCRPVIYIPIQPDNWQCSGTLLLKDIEAIFKSHDELVVEKLNRDHFPSRGMGCKLTNPDHAAIELSSQFQKEFLAFIKPFNSQLALNEPNNFYMEREWRKFGNLEFRMGGLEKILVAEGYSARLKTEFPKYSSKVIEI